MAENKQKQLRSLPQLFFEQAEAYGARKFIWNKHHDRWIGLSYQEVAQQVRP